MQILHIEYNGTKTHYVNTECHFNIYHPKYKVCLKIKKELASL